MSLHRSVEIVTEQARSTARSMVNNAASEVRRETSVTGWANRMVGKLSRRHAGPSGGSGRRNRGEGVYILPAEAVRQGRQGEREDAFVAPDGYVRKSPVQEIAEDPDYRRRLLIRGILAAAVVILAASVLYALLRLHII